MDDPKVVLKSAEYLEVIIEQTPSGKWRVWVNDRQHCLLRAFSIDNLGIRANGDKVLVIDKDKETK